MIHLSYFDLLLQDFLDRTNASQVFEQYVHWGFWENPRKAPINKNAFFIAMERLNDELLLVADLKDCQTVLDAGCGFGGTLATTQKRSKEMRLIKINIDPRQLEIAKKQVPEAFFVQGDGCSLHFKESSFDRTLAVKSIFHFPSCLRFLQEASQVLKLGRRIVLSDFVPRRPKTPSNWLENMIKKKAQKGFGFLGDDYKDGDYSVMAELAQLRLVTDRDITRNTLATYAMLQNLFPPPSFMTWPIRLLKWISYLGVIRYRILCFTKNNNPPFRV